jgi:cytosine/adenosine deaminase-related metal-dependent hydrolase
VAHCPTANLKLGSGVADVVGLRARDGIAVGIGCDGPPCNNDLDVLEEMRLAALLQINRHGPGEFTARDALELATCEGARAMGLEDTVGSLEPGKAGDLVVLDPGRPSMVGDAAIPVYDRVVFSASRDAVRWVVVDGEILVDGGSLTHLEEAEIAARAREAAATLRRRAGL